MAPEGGGPGPDQGQRNYALFIKTLEEISIGLKLNAELLQKNLQVNAALLEAINHEDDGLIPALDEMGADLQELTKALNAHSIRFGLGSIFAPKRRG